MLSALLTFVNVRAITEGKQCRTFDVSCTEHLNKFLKPIVELPVMTPLTLFIAAGPALMVDVNLNIRSMGPISEKDMVSVTWYIYAVKYSQCFLWCVLWWLYHQDLDDSRRVVTYIKSVGYVPMNVSKYIDAPVIFVCPVTWQHADHWSQNEFLYIYKT